jgi:DNA-binding LacI/PurR family transcriptional regulator
MIDFTQHDNVSTLEPTVGLGGVTQLLETARPQSQQPSQQPIRRRRTKPVRLVDVAKAAGVSIATVSLVVNQHPRISPATQRRVRSVIDKLGYKPNRGVQVLSGAQSTHAVTWRKPTLAVLLPPQTNAFGDTYFGELISGITEKASSMGQSVTFEHASPEFVRAGRHLSLLERQGADGLLLMGFGDYDRFLDDFAKSKHPVVLVDSRVTRCQLDSVGCDYRAGAQQAMNYLLQLGHRRIGLITAAAGRCAREVADAYRVAMDMFGVRPGEGWIADGRFTEEGGHQAAEKILRRHPDVTALFAASDKMAIGAVHSAQSNGLVVPRDLSIIGFDNVRHAAFMNPPLSTIHLPLHEVGARACERLMERLRGRKDVVNDLLPIHLVVRESTALSKDLPPAGSSAA